MWHWKTEIQLDLCCVCLFGSLIQLSKPSAAPLYVLFAPPPFKRGFAPLSLSVEELRLSSPWAAYSYSLRNQYKICWFDLLKSQWCTPFPLGLLRPPSNLVSPRQSIKGVFHLVSPWTTSVIKCAKRSRIFAISSFRTTIALLFRKPLRKTHPTAHLSGPKHFVASIWNCKITASREKTSTCFLSAGQTKCEDAGCKSGRLHCCCRVAATVDSRSRLCWLRNNTHFPSAALRGNESLFLRRWLSAATKFSLTNWYIFRENPQFTPKLKAVWFYG